MIVKSERQTNSIKMRINYKVPSDGMRRDEKTYSNRRHTLRWFRQSLRLFSVVMVCGLSNFQAAPYGGGSGTPEDPTKLACGRF